MCKMKFEHNIPILNVFTYKIECNEWLYASFHSLFHYKNNANSLRTNSATLHIFTTTKHSHVFAKSHSLKLSCDKANANKSSNLSSAYLLSQLHWRESKQRVCDWRKMFWKLWAGWEQPEESQKQAGHEDQQAVLHALAERQRHWAEKEQRSRKGALYIDTIPHL